MGNGLWVMGKEKRRRHSPAGTYWCEDTSSGRCSSHRTLIRFLIQANPGAPEDRVR
jgi:hypothetical protein